MSIKEAIKGLLEGKGLDGALTDLLESDKDERSLERSHDDADAFFKLCMKKLRRQKNLGELTFKEWSKFLEGARNVNYHVYIVNRVTGGVTVQYLKNKAPFLPRDDKVYSIFVGLWKDELLLRWRPFTFSTYGLNIAAASPSINPKIIVTPTDVTKLRASQEIIDGLRIAGIGNEH